MPVCFGLLYPKITADLDGDKKVMGKKGLANGLTHMGDPDFALYMRKSFASSMGYSKTILEKPVIGIIDTTSGFNNCHRNIPDLIEAAQTWRTRGWRFTYHLPDNLPWGKLCFANDIDVSQFDEHGRRRDDPCPTDGCSDPYRWL